MRVLVVAHRWLGVVLCGLVGLWFLSGIGMMYAPFPEIASSDRLEHATPLDAATIEVSPAQAAALAGPDAAGAAITLTTFDGRPVYRLVGAGREVVVFADTGDVRSNVSRTTLDRVAGAWTGRPVSSAAVRLMTDVDQWTVQAAARRRLPLLQYAWPDGEVVYLDAGQGDVVQHTTRASRLGAYLGPIPHWLYFTPLRKRAGLWTAVVVWSSALVTALALSGVLIGLSRYSPRRRYRVNGRASTLPYAGNKRWHAILGLMCGAAAVTWAFSGLLSMEPFPLRGAAATDRPGTTVAEALQGTVDVAAFDARPPSAALLAFEPRSVRQLALSSFRGEAVYLASLADGSTRIAPVSGGVRTAFGVEEVLAALAEVEVPGRIRDSRVLAQYDRYYLDRHRRRPLPVVVAVFDDPDRTRVYVDPASGALVGQYSRRDWMARWLYHGLHSLDFPWLYNHRPLWDIVVIAFMLGGTALSVTSIALGWQVAGRTVRRVRRG